MKTILSLVGVALLAAPAMAADIPVAVHHVHMCCEGCADEVVAILAKVDGVSGATADQKTTSAKFTAKDATAAQRALDALSAGGFHGSAGANKEFAFKDDSGVKPGKVKSLTVTGYHNSCGGCVKSFREAIKVVPGVAGDNAKTKNSTATVTGDFDAAELVKALNKAGFHVKVKE